MKETKWMLSGAVVKAAGVSSETVREWVRWGKLRATRAENGYFIFGAGEVACFLARRRKPTGRESAKEVDFGTLNGLLSEA